MKKFLFITAFIFGVISFLWSFFCHQNEIELPFLGHLNADIRVNIETPSDKIMLAGDNWEIAPYIMKTKNTYVSYEINQAPIYKLGLKGDISTIDNVVIFVGQKLFYFTKKDVENFKRDKNGVYLFPKDVKYGKYSGYITDKGPLWRISFAILSFFYDFWFFIVPWFWFILAFFLYGKNGRSKDFKGGIYWILILAFIIRIADNGFNFWSDELYTATLAGNPDLPFMTTFVDPGNPPLFFILARFWMMIFGNSESICRLLPTIFSIGSIYFVYKFLKENLKENKTPLKKTDGEYTCVEEAEPKPEEAQNSAISPDLPHVDTKKAANPKIENSPPPCAKGLSVTGTALLGAFLLAINIYSIHSAREFRAYQLGAMLAILAAIYLFRIIKYDKPRDYWVYSLLGILMANTHYFQILVIAGNFFYGIFQIKRKWKFFAANFLAALFFLPYFLTTALNNALLNTEFNGTLKCPPLREMWVLFGQFFNTKIVSSIVLITALILLIKRSKTSQSKVYFYALYICLFTYVSSWVFSLIRPIIKSFYYINIIPFWAIISALLIYFLSRLRFKPVWCLILICLYLSGRNFFSKENLLLINFDSIFNYAANDCGKYRIASGGGGKIGIAIHDTPNYALYYKEKLRGDEILIMYDFPPKLPEIYNEILNSPAQVIYMRLEGKKFPVLCAAFSQFATVSMIRSNRDVLIARIVKKDNTNE